MVGHIECCRPGTIDGAKPGTLVGKTEISSKRRNDGKSHMAASGTLLLLHKDHADRSVDHLPRWNCSHSPPTHGIIPIPVPIN
jgi:hypothetical protein